MEANQMTHDEELIALKEELTALRELKAKAVEMANNIKNRNGGDPDCYCLSNPCGCDAKYNYDLAIGFLKMMGDE